MTTPPEILQEQLRRRLDSRRLRQLLGDGGLGGRSGLVAPRVPSRRVGGVPMMPASQPEPPAGGFENVVVSGTVTIEDGQTIANVTHGLGAEPAVVVATAREVEAVGVVARNSALFSIERAGSVGPLEVDWATFGTVDTELPSWPDIEAWLRPEELAHLSDGASVDIWPAVTGQSAIAMTADLPVIAAADAVNGYIPVRFNPDGIAYFQDWLTFIHGPGFLLDAIEGDLFVVHQRKTNGSTGQGAPAINSGSSGSGTAGHWPVGSNTYDRNFRTSRVLVGNVGDYQPGPFCVEVSSSAADGWKFRRNGTIVGTASHAFPATINQASLGGNRANGYFDHRASYYEVIVFRRVRTDAERNEIHSYLNAKYGLSLPII